MTIHCARALVPALILAFAGIPAAHAQETPTTEGLQVGIGNCVFAPKRTGEESRALLGAIAAAAISKGVNMLGTALKNAGEAKTWTISGSRNFEAATENFPQCIQIVRGSFLTRKGSGYSLPWTSVDPSALTGNGIFLASAPSFFFEGEIVSSADKSALSIRPLFSHFAEPIGTRLLRPGKSRNIALFIAFTAPSASPTQPTAASANIVLGNHKPGMQRTYLVPTKGAQDPNENDVWHPPMGSSWFTIAKADTRKPMTVYAVLSETQGKSGFYSFLASVAADDKVAAETRTTLERILVPGKAEEMAATEAKADDVLANTAEEKYVAALQKLETCKATATPANAAAAKKAMREYLRADEALPTGFKSKLGLLSEEEIDLINIEKPSAEISRVCSERYADLQPAG